MARHRLILFHKPYQVLCQFTDTAGRATLAAYVPIPGVYPAGRLDFDSEGLVVLTNVGSLQHLITNPRHKIPKTYWVQVEGVPSAQTLAQLAQGVQLRDGMTQPTQVHSIEPPPVGPRIPPIRERRHIPTTWIEMTITEGRNRQIRRMTAAVGHPTLRLIRQRIGPWQLASLSVGAWKEIPCPRNRTAFLVEVLRFTQNDSSECTMAKLAVNSLAEKAEHGSEREKRRRDPTKTVIKQRKATSPTG